MVTPLTFRCTACGNCCRSLRVAVTALDVARLAQQTGAAPSELVCWLAPDEVDMAGEPDSFVELREGRRLMVLAHAAGGCALLNSEGRCTAYAARPRDCRAFPFDFETVPVRHLRLLPLGDCEYAEDGRNDAAELEAEDAARWRELRSYQAWVAVWNRRAWHRRRLHKSVADSAEFLRRALLELQITSPSIEPPR